MEVVNVRGGRVLVFEVLLCVGGDHQAEVVNYQGVLGVKGGLGGEVLVVFGEGLGRAGRGEYLVYYGVLLIKGSYKILS